MLFLVTAFLLSALSPNMSLSDPTPGGPLAVPPPLPFSAGERLSYDLTWLGMRAGIATMAVQKNQSPDGRPQIVLSLVARSSPAVTKIYPVENRVTSRVDIESFLPVHMTFTRREGKRSNDFDYTFRHSEGLVTAVKDGKSAELPIPSDAQDAISCLYYVRKICRWCPERPWP